MASVLDLSKFAFSGEEITAMNQLVADAVVRSPKVTEYLRVIENIVVDKEIGFYGKGGLTGKAFSGCEPTAQDWVVATRALKWEPVDWEVLIHECASNLKSTAGQYSFKNNVPFADLTSTDYMAIAAEVMTVALEDFVTRFVWFNDTEALNVEDGGNITDDVDVDYFNINDGLFVQLDAIVAENPAQLVAITANAETTEEEQVEALDGDAAVAILKDLVYKAPLTMKGVAKNAKKILVTQSIADAYSQYLSDKGISETYSNLVNGVPTLMYDGIAVVAMPIWDEMISKYNNTGTALINPHRAVYYVDGALGLGVNKASEFETLDIWYDKDTRKVKMEAMGIADVKILNPEQVMYATGVVES